MADAGSDGLTPRERVLLALNHQEADRVPTALMGGPYALVDELYFKLVDRLKLGQPAAPFRRGHNISYMDDRLLDALGTDFRYAWPATTPSSPTEEGQTPGTFRDNYGQLWKRALPYYYAGKGLLAETSRLEDIQRLVHWPDPAEPRWMAGVAERARYLRQQTPFFVAMRMVSPYGPYQTACDLRGSDNFLMDMAANPEFALALIDRVTGVLEGLLEQAMLAGGEFFDLIELPGDDYAGNTNLIFSPRMFRRFIRPALERLVAVIRRHNPGVKIMFHSDGAIAGLLEDLIEIGVDVVHPLEPLPVMDLAEIKKRFGDRLTFLGGIDISHALPGSRQDVIAEVRRRIAQLAPGGGYILSPANHIQADVPVENVLTLYQAAREFGKYPLKKV